MVGKRIGRLILRSLRKAGCEPLGEDAYFGLRRELIKEIGELRRENERLDAKLIELDGIVCSTMECVEEIRDMQHPAPEKREDSNNLAAIFSEYLNGAQPKRSDEE